MDLKETSSRGIWENAIRKDFLPSEMVAIAMALELKEKKAAKERRERKPISAGKLPGQNKGRTRDKVARYAGVSGRTLEKATEVVEAAAAEPEKYAPLVEEMDRTGSQNRLSSVSLTHALRS